MNRKYLGHLPHHDQMYQYLKYEIQPQMGGFIEHPSYRVFQLTGSNDVYLYEERRSGKRVIGKFFLSARQPDRAAADRRLEREFHNLEFMRQRGMTDPPFYIARALGRNHDLNALLVTEHCDGELMSDVILRAIRSRDSGLLFGKLTALGYFLSAFHNRTVNEFPVDFNRNCNYMDGMIGTLQYQRLINADDADELYRLRDSWRGQPRMWADRQVLIHGDATPDNFMFGDGLYVITFDLERLKAADRVFDLGRIAAELMHFFLVETGNKYLAEPFIGHFLWEYSCHFPDRERTFAAITRRLPFYMGMTLLRIARNSWLDWNYRKRLTIEAKLCLRGI